MEYRDLSTENLKLRLADLRDAELSQKSIYEDTRIRTATETAEIQRVLDQRAEIELLKRESEVKYSLKQLRAAFEKGFKYGYNQGVYNGGSGNGDDMEIAGFDERDY